MARHYSDYYHYQNSIFDLCLQGVLLFFFANVRILSAFPICESVQKPQIPQVPIRILPHISIKIRKGPPLRVALGVVSLPRSGHFGGDMTTRLFNNYTIYWGGATVKYTRYCTQIYALFLHRFSVWCIYFFPCEDRGCRRVSAAAAAATGGGTGGRKSAARRVPPVTPGPRRSTRQLRRAGRQAECERGGSPAPAGGA